jgi:hypothetical protein
MRAKATIRNEKRRQIGRQTSPGGEALAIREAYPPEEFAGFENFGEFPEWHPGEAESGEEPELQTPITGDHIHGHRS